MDAINREYKLKVLPGSRLGGRDDITTQTAISKIFRTTVCSRGNNARHVFSQPTKSLFTDNTDHLMFTQS